MLTEPNVDKTATPKVRGQRACDGDSGGGHGIRKRVGESRNRGGGAGHGPSEEWEVME